MVIPIADRHLEYARQVESRLREANIRCHVDDRSERMQAKIRADQLQKIPYMLVVGDREASVSAVSLRTGSPSRDMGTTSLDDTLTMIRED
ncbi:His/Gly/Thr/Pro-type tRNA ligase C-terminal domain-containing protein [Chloroflexota bacterium]